MSAKPNELPLEGVRVLDLSWIIAGPTATRLPRHDGGAEVIKVGSARRPDPSTRGAPFPGVQPVQALRRFEHLPSRRLGTCDAPRFGVRHSYRELRGRCNRSVSDLATTRSDRQSPTSSCCHHPVRDIAAPTRTMWLMAALLQYYTGWNAISGYPNSEANQGWAVG